MPYVFAVDGGGTQSRAILLTDSGRVVYYAKGPGVNYHDVGAHNAVATIKRLYQEALTAARARLEECRGICLGLAGVGREQDRNILKPLLHDQFDDRYMLISDAEVALVAGTLSEYGIIVIAGTGSIIYGRREQGGEGRVGGYGPLLSDEGSGYRVALDALTALVKSADGFGIPTPMQPEIFDRLNLHSLDELVNWVNSSAATREKISALAPLVIKAAQEHDPVADQILNSQGDQLARSVEILHKRLKFADRFEVVLGGGLFAESSYYRQIVRRKILYLLPGADILTPRLEPVLGAALYAYSIAGVGLNEDLLDIIRRSYNEYMKTYTDQKPVHQMTLNPQNVREIAKKSDTSSPSHENRGEDSPSEEIQPRAMK
jgi:N-acetylglucosamine kinase